MNAATRAVAATYAQVLRRRSRRTWVVFPGPLSDGSADVADHAVRRIPAKEDKDALTGGGARAA